MRRVREHEREVLRTREICYLDYACYCLALIFFRPADFCPFVLADSISAHTVCRHKNTPCLQD